MEENPLNAVFKKFQVALDPTKLILLLNEKGEPTSIINETHSRHPSFQFLIQRNKSVFSLFDFGRLNDLNQAVFDASYPLHYNAMKEVKIHIDYHINFPHTHIRVQKIGSNQFAGFISFPQILPNIEHSNADIILYIDNKNRIQGYNNRLYTYLKKRFGSPDRLFNCPVEKLLRPTPNDIQHDYLKDISSNKDVAWQEHGASHTPTPYDWIATSKDLVKFTDTSAVINSTYDTTQYLLFRAPLDTAQNDFKYSVTAELIHGHGPLLCVGSPVNHSQGPLSNGYQAGEFYLNEGYQLKRNGHHLTGATTKHSKGLVKYSLMKTGRALIFNVNNSRTLQYYDPYFIQDNHAAFGIGIRANSRFVIRHASIEKKTTLDKTTPFEDDEQIIKLDVAPSRYYSMNRFFNDSLSISFNFLSGFYLHDVTQMKEKVDQYLEKYRTAERKSSRLAQLYANPDNKEAYLIGISNTICRIRERAEAVTDADAPVLIQGPTGSGKEVVARYIHSHGPRNKKPFVKVDCTTIPYSLIESQLFGHEKGAFTGAVDRKIGRFEQANGGTIFFDEIGNLNKETQAKLLGVLQDKSITRIGGEGQIALDIRVIAASNIELLGLIKKGLFRDDLFYRINAIPITLPALSEHKEDIPVLCRYFIEQFNALNNKNIIDLTPGAYDKIFRHPWPGNIRELRNIVQTAFIFCQNDHIDEEHIQFYMTAETPDKRSGSRKQSYHLKNMDKEKLIAVIIKNNGVVSAIASELGISRVACYENFRKFEISIQQYRPH